MGYSPGVNPSRELREFKKSVTFEFPPLSKEYERHAWLADDSLPNERQLNFFRRILNREGSQGDCAESILNLSEWLNRASGKPAYIFLDEYDTPLQAAYSKNYYDGIIDCIRSFMVQAFKGNPHLKQAV